MAIRLVVLDLDGTVYRGDEVIPNAPEAIQTLRKRGLMVRFVTNNSRATPQWLVDKLSRMGIQASPEEALSSGMAAADQLAREGLTSAYVVGEAGLAESLRDRHIEVVNCDSGGAIVSETSRRADAVVAGIDRSFTYAKLNGAMQQIRRGAKFVATNADTTYPVENGGLVPGAGSVVAAITACSGAEPTLVGKPSPLMLEMVVAESGCAKDEILVVGDRIGTDIEWGRAYGCPTHLVLTGVTETAPPGVRWSEDLLGLPELG